MAGECLKPWPEQGEARITESCRGCLSITNPESGVMVYKQTVDFTHLSSRPGKKGPTKFWYIISVSSWLVARLTVSGVVVVSYCSDAIFTPPRGPSMAGKP